MSASPEIPENMLRPQEQADLESEIASCDYQLHSVNSSEQVNKKSVAQRKRRLQHDLETQKIPDLEGPELDRLNRERLQLEEAVSKEMLTRDVMMRNPPGAVGKNIAFEKKHKQNMLRWKKIQLLLNRGSDDPDIANVERLRPEGASLMNMTAAQIPPKAISVPSEQYMQNYDGISWEKEQALEAKLRHLDELSAKMEEVIARAKPRKELTPEQMEIKRASLAKARQVRAANLQAKKAEQEAASEEA